MITNPLEIVTFFKLLDYTISLTERSGFFLLVHSLRGLDTWYLISFTRRFFLQVAILYPLQSHANWD